MLVKDIPEFPNLGDRIITVGDANWTPVACNTHNEDETGFNLDCEGCQITWRNLYTHLVAVALNNPE